MGFQWHKSSTENRGCVVGIFNPTWPNSDDGTAWI